MAEFSAEVYQNEFLPDGGTDVHAVVTVTCTGAGAAGQEGQGDAAEIVIVDTSGSMGEVNIRAAQRASAAAIDVNSRIMAVVSSSMRRRSLRFQRSQQPRQESYSGAGLERPPSALH